MFKRFAAKKYSYTYIGALSLCLIVGLFLTFSHDRSSDVFVAGQPGQGTSVTNDTSEITRSVLAAETYTVTPEQDQPANSQDKTKAKAVPSGSGETGGQSTSPASSPAAARAPAESIDSGYEDSQRRLSVQLSINDSPKGSVFVTRGSNHCDVLSQALTEGIIVSLDMRYYEQYKTQGVYVIDGQGSTDVIWWTYKVNGKSPPYGCSNVIVQDGDQVNWEYIRR